MGALPMYRSINNKLRRGEYLHFETSEDEIRIFKNGTKFKITSYYCL